MSNYKLSSKETLKRKDETEASSSTTEPKNLTHKFVKYKISGRRSSSSSSSYRKSRSRNNSRHGYFADEKREAERLERKKKIDFFPKQQNNTRTETNKISGHRSSSSSSSYRKSRSRSNSRHGYFADEKREAARLERLKKFYFQKQQNNTRTEKNKISGHRSSSSSSSYRKSRSRSNSRHRRSLTRSPRHSRSRTRSRSRDRYKSTPYIPPIYPSVIAAPSTSDYVYNPQNWLRQVVPIAPVAPPRFPFFIRPYGNRFPHMTSIPPVPYPMPTIISRHMYRARYHRQRNSVNITIEIKTKK